ncbi:MAG: TetR/AcrR family transcriptional regulator [Rhodocyclaceae bacterium]|nr:TetR/AcrR family transcriptional regulator [Rhodocyclaceae bacterium]
MGKGEDTRSKILDAALAQASEGGFESLTIGTLAAHTGLSKSGLFAHFGSREELQIAAIDAAAERFADTVFVPALKAGRGLPRVRAIFEHWLRWTEDSGLAHGCPLHAAAIEFDDRPGPVREHLVARYEILQRNLERAFALAVDAGDLPADSDPGQYAFAALGIVFAYYHAARLLRRPDAADRARAAFDRLLAGAPAPAA